MMMNKKVHVYILHTYIISPKCTLCRLVSRQGNARHFVVVLRVCDEKKWIPIFNQMLCMYY